MRRTVVGVQCRRDRVCLCLLSFVGVHGAESGCSTVGNAMINNGRRGPAVHCTPAGRCAAPSFSRPGDAIKAIRAAACSTLTRRV